MNNTRDIFLFALLLVAAFWVYNRVNEIKRVGEVVPTPVTYIQPIQPVQVTQPSVDIVETPFYEAPTVAPAPATTTTFPSLNQALGNPDGTNPFIGDLTVDVP